MLILASEILSKYSHMNNKHHSTVRNCVCVPACGCVKVVTVSRTQYQNTSSSVSNTVSYQIEVVGLQSSIGCKNEIVISTTGSFLAICRTCGQQCG